MKIQHEAQVGGFFKITKYKVGPDGKPGICTYDGDWFHNLITDLGMNFMGSTAGWMSAGLIGTGNATPVVSSNSLGGFLSGVDINGAVGSDGTTAIAGGTVTSNAITTATAAPWFISKTTTYRFPPGAGTGILAEIGIASTRNPATGTLFARELIRDGGGTPTTITKLADEFLDLTYEFRVWPNTTDVVDTVVLGGITYGRTMRPSNLTRINTSRDSVIESGGQGMAWRQSGSGGHQAQTYTGAIGTVVQEPIGEFQSGVDSTFLPVAYVNNSLQTDANYTIGLNDGVDASGIGAIRVYNPFYAMQIGFTPNVPKLNTQKFIIDMRFSWTRHV